MASKLNSREALRARIQARQAAKKAAEKIKTAGRKFATLRRIALEEPQEVDSAIAQLAEGFGELSTALTTMAQNLDLGAAPVEGASLPALTAKKKNYASRFRRLAEEAPEQFEMAYNEVYQALDGLAEDMENAADNLGIELAAPVAEGMESEPAAIAEEEHEVVEEHKEEGNDVPEELSEHVEEEGEKEASNGSDWFVTDRDETGEAKKPTVASRKSVVTSRK